MPRAGWCRECVGWVWVDGDGACQHGHGSECVSALYDARVSGDGPEAPREKAPVIPEGEPPAPESQGGLPPVLARRGFGAGEFPDELYRFNWGAFLLPQFWGLAHAAWPIVLAWLLTIFVPIALAGLFLGDGGVRTTAAIAGITVLSELTLGGVRLWAGLSANQISWQREARRLTLLEGTNPRFDVARFVSRQRVWAAVGAGLALLSVVGAAVLAFSVDPAIAQMREELGITGLDAGVSVLFLLVEVALGFWLGSRMRSQGPDRPVDAPDAA